MDQMNMNPPASPTPQMPEPSVSAPEKSSVGPVIGALIIVLLLAAGALYFWGAQLNKGGVNNAPPTILGDDSAGLPPTRSSDTVADIEADISATDMDTFEGEVEADMQAIESSM